MRFEIAARATDADDLGDRTCCEIDDRDRAVELVTQVRVATVTFDCDCVGKPDRPESTASHETVA
jgi:hypothetical protein